MLKVENLSVNYGYITALSEISFHVDQGEIITLIGSNGAGKTTSLHAISGLVHKAGGSVQFKGTDISRMAPDKIVKMGMCHVPEGRKIFPDRGISRKSETVKEPDPGASGRAVQAFPEIKRASDPGRRKPFRWRAADACNFQRTDDGSGYCDAG